MTGSGLLPGETAGPPPRPRRTKRAQQIVDAARTILETEGRPALTMRRLGGDLGIRAPSLYKHFAGKAEVELALIDEALVEVGRVSHGALRDPAAPSPLAGLLAAYRRHSLAHGHLYRLATTGALPRASLTPGLEEWAGNPWYVVTGDSSVAQALWSLAHGMVVLELDDRYPPGSDLDAAWRAGARAFQQAAGPSVEVDVLRAPRPTTGPRPDADR